MTAGRRDDILRAAASLFSRHGVRRASMALIAREAGVAKPTLYAHFGGKDALFAAVCGNIGEQIEEAARQAAASAGRLEERVAAVLAAKFTVMFDLVETSPYAQELLNPAGAAAQESIANADRAFRRLLGDVLTSAARAGELDLAALGLTVERLTAQLMQAGHGASYGAKTPAEQRANLRALVESILRAGLRGPAAARHAGQRLHPSARRRS